MTPVELFENWFNFSFDPQLGYVSTCLGNIGTTFTVSSLIKLDNLSFEEIDKFCDENELLIRGTHGVHTPVINNVYAVQNQVRFCHDTKTIIEKFTRNAAALVRLNDAKDRP